MVQTIAVGNFPDYVSSYGAHAWVVNGGSNNVTELDASTGAVVQTTATAAKTDPMMHRTRTGEIVVSS